MQAVFYRDASGREPVRDFLGSLDDDSQAAIEHQIVRLNLLTNAVPHLPFPHSSQVDGELRELRCHYGRELYRILYRRSGQLIVLLHVFAKRSVKIDQRDIRTAQARWDDFKARMDAKPRIPPRAAGRDAP
ncbi:MAG TPA: type II toxin-antitoxin system RelE/ParE family toxin [Solirubrobacteraceae bacterium]|jgi:phage-related protein